MRFQCMCKEGRTDRQKQCDFYLLRNKNVTEISRRVGVYMEIRCNSELLKVELK